MVQAVGGSMLNPVAMSIITNTFTNPRERAQAVGVWAAVVGVSMALGPVVGGVLVSSVGWRSIFWINLPVGLAAIVLTLRFIPESRAPKARRIDGLGQVLVIIFLASLTYGIIEAPDRGWGSAVIVTAFAVSLVSLIGLISWEGRCEEPLINLRFFRSVPFSGAAISAVAAFATLGGFLFLNTLYLQDVRGFSPLRAGLYTLPMAVMTMVLSPISGRIVGTRGPRIPLLTAGGGPHRQLCHAQPDRSRPPPSPGCSLPTSCSGSASGPSTHPSRPQPCRACPGLRPEWPPPSPRPPARSVQLSAWRLWVRCSRPRSVAPGGLGVARDDPCRLVGPGRVWCHRPRARTRW